MSSPERVRRPPLWVWVLGGTALIAAGYVGAIGESDNDLSAFFLPAARLALGGHPLAIYTVQTDGIPPDDGPLSILGLAALTRLAGIFGITPGTAVLRAVIAIACAILALLAGREAWLAVERLRGATLSWGLRMTLAAVVAANPTLWRGIAHYGHFELALLLWLSLRAARDLATGHTGRAGMLIGLDLLTRGTAALVLLPLALALAWDRRWRDLLRYLAAALGVALLGIAPFLLAHPAATLDALAGSRARLPVGAGSLWVVVIDTPLEPVVQRMASAIIFLVATGWGIWLLRRRAVRNPAPPPVTASATLYLLLGLAALAFPGFSPMVWPYYYTECIAPLAIWGLATADARDAAAWLPAAIGIVGMLFAEITLHFPPFETIGYGLGLLQFTGLILVVRQLVRQGQFT